MVTRDPVSRVTTYELAFAIVDLMGMSTEYASQFLEGLRFGLSFLVNEGSGSQIGWVSAHRLDPSTCPPSLRCSLAALTSTRVGTAQAGYYPHSIVYGWYGGQKEPAKTGIVELAPPEGWLCDSHCASCDAVGDGTSCANCVTAGHGCTCASLPAPAAFVAACDR